MHRTYLADVERGVRNLSLSSIARLVDGIGVSLSAFFATMETVDPSSPNGGPGKIDVPRKSAGRRKSPRSSGRGSRVSVGK